MLKQNDRVMIVLEGQMANGYARQMGALDLLPAGLEIEVRRSPANGGKAYSWLDTLNDRRWKSANDDRFVAAFSIGSQDQERPDPKKPLPPPPTFRLAYIARAVTAGTFVMPAGVVEDRRPLSMRAPTWAASRSRRGNDAVTIRVRIPC